MRMVVQRHAPAALSSGKTRHPLYSRLGGPQGRSGRLRKVLPPPGFYPLTVQLVAIRYTDCFNHWRDFVIVVVNCLFIQKDENLWTERLLSVNLWTERLLSVKCLAVKL
jgi:hypothetical protein